MKTKHLFIVALIFIFSGASHAQTDSVSSSPATAISIQTEIANVHQLNIVKLNLDALFIKNFSVQYERVIKKYLSGVLSFRFMPEGTLPYKNFIYNRFGDNDPDFEEIIYNMRVGNFAITPQVRFYVGKKGFGRGFYIAPAYRFAKFKISNINYNYGENDNSQETINMSGSLTANYGGFILGAQWFLGRHFTIDWWFFGPLFGIEKSNFNGYSSVTLSPEDQQDIRDSLEDLDIPRTDVTYSVDAHNVSLNMRGPFAGISSGLAFGFRF